jgi:hypothetical protein
MLPASEKRCAELVKSCIKAAKKMLELFGEIDRSGCITKSSFTDFQGCSIATIILLVAGILKRDLCYEARISFGLTCLRRMAGGHLAAVNGVYFIEALKSIADEAAEKLRKSSTVASSATLAMMTAETTIPQQSPAVSGHWDPTMVTSQPNMAWTSDTASADQSIDQDGCTRMLTEGAHSDPFSLLQFNNEAFLMELTELEMRGISGS